MRCEENHLQVPSKITRWKQENAFLVDRLLPFLFGGYSTWRDVEKAVSYEDRALFVFNGLLNPEKLRSENLDPRHIQARCSAIVLDGPLDELGAQRV